MKNVLKLQRLVEEKVSEPVVQFSCTSSMLYCLVRP